MAGGDQAANGKELPPSENGRLPTILDKPGILPERRKLYQGRQPVRRGWSGTVGPSRPRPPRSGNRVLPGTRLQASIGPAFESHEVLCFRGPEATNSPHIHHDLQLPSRSVGRIAAAKAVLRWRICCTLTTLRHRPEQPGRNVGTPTQRALSCRRMRTAGPLLTWDRSQRARSRLFPTDLLPAPSIRQTRTMAELFEDRAADRVVRWSVRRIAPARCSGRRATGNRGDDSESREPPPRPDA